MMIWGRCGVTPLMVTRELSCTVMLDKNSFTESYAETEGISSQQKGRAHSACVYIKHTDCIQSPEETRHTKPTDKAAQRGPKATKTLAYIKKLYFFGYTVGPAF